MAEECTVVLYVVLTSRVQSAAMQWNARLYENEKTCDTLIHKLLIKFKKFLLIPLFHIMRTFLSSCNEYSFIL